VKEYRLEKIFSQIQDCTLNFTLETFQNACPATMKVLGVKRFMFWEKIEADDIYWNFEKFIIDRQGRPQYRVHPAFWKNFTSIEPYLNFVLNSV